MATVSMTVLSITFPSDLLMAWISNLVSGSFVYPDYQSKVILEDTPVKWHLAQLLNVSLSIT